MNQLCRSLWTSRLWFFIFWLNKLNLHINCYCVRGTRTQPLICVGCSVHYWVPCAINKGGFFEIAFVVVVDTHLPRFEALAYVLPHFDALTHVVIRASSSVCLACVAGGIAWGGAVFQKKGVGTRRLKYRLPENPGILNSPHTSVRRNGLVEGHTYVNHVR